MTSKTKILIVDDHNMFRSSIVAMLLKCPDFHVVGEAANGKEAIIKSKDFHPEVVLMDINLPEETGIEVSESILAENSSIKIIGLSAEKQSSDIEKMIEAGAKGFLLKSSSIEELFTAIRTVAKGTSYFSPSVSDILLEYMAKSRSNRSKKHSALITDRELEILKYVADEMTSKEIAEKLYISPRTVETHKRNLIQKLKVRSTIGLVKYYLQKFETTLTRAEHWSSKVS